MEKNEFLYFGTLTPRQQLNDLMHKYAQKNHIPYAESWVELEHRYYRRYNIALFVDRKKHRDKTNARLSITEFLALTGRLTAAIEIGHEMTEVILMEKHHAF